MYHTDQPLRPHCRVIYCEKWFLVERVISNIFGPKCYNLYSYLDSLSMIPDEMIEIEEWMNRYQQSAFYTLNVYSLSSFYTTTIMPYLCFSTYVLEQKKVASIEFISSLFFIFRLQTNRPCSIEKLNWQSVEVKTNQILNLGFIETKTR